jgi:hypothetical protein
LLYLSGELSATESAEFEKLIVESSIVQDLLERQSQLLTRVYDISSSDDRLELPSHTSDSNRGYKITGLISLIAAMFLLVIISQGTSRRTASESVGSANPSEESRIASVWATADDFGHSDAFRLDEVSDELLGTDDAGTFVDLPGPFGGETVPSWMLAALEPTSDLLDGDLLDDDVLEPSATFRGSEIQ